MVQYLSKKPSSYVGNFVRCAGVCQVQLLKVCVLSDRFRNFAKTLHRNSLPHHSIEIIAFIQCGFCAQGLADFNELLTSSDTQLFKKILTCPDRILQMLLL